MEKVIVQTGAKTYQITDQGRRWKLPIYSADQPQDTV